VQRADLVTRAADRVLEALGLLLVQTENKNTRARLSLLVLAQPVGEASVLVARVVEDLDSLLNALVGGQLVRADSDLDRVGEERRGKAADRLGPGGGD
jgi:hypothetical protein